MSDGTTPSGSAFLYKMADILHMPWELVCILVPFVVVGLYAFLITTLFRITNAVVAEFKFSRGLMAFLLFFPMIILCTIVILLELVHTLLFCWAGYTMLKHTRNWWWRGRHV